MFLVAVLAPLGAFAASAKRAAPTRPATVSNSEAYKGAIILDAASGRVLFEDNADLVNPPASMVKLMTFAVLSDRLKSGAITLATPVTVNAAEARFAMKRDSTSVWLKQNETFPVEELIYAMMIQSANDAALVLARASAGSPEAFVELMNAKARELGMTHSVFRTPHGLTPAGASSATSDLTTARDYALLCRHLLLNTDVLKYTSVKERSFGGTQRPQPVAMRNHNHLLGKIPGVDGLKTGYTIPAGFCLSTTVERNGRRLVIVTLGGTSSKARDLKIAELIEKGFDALPVGGPAFAGPKAPATPPAAAATAPVAAASSPAPAAANDSPLGAPTKAAVPATSDAAIKFSLPPAPKKK